ncbi:MAG: hypothetical protein AAFW98_07785 [Pseudomonadota bacterium]
MTAPSPPTNATIAATAKVLIDNAPGLAGLTIAPELAGAVRVHLVTSLRLAHTIGPGAPESGPVFRP